MRIAIYTRVSTNDGRQTVENQLVPLKEWAEKLEGEVIVEYSDKSSGTKSDRHDLNQLLEAAHRREFDCLLLWSLDRLSREGISRLFFYLDKLKKCGVRVMSLQESWLDTAGPVSDLLLAIIGWVSQQERNRIRERIISGLKIAKAKGKKFGRPQRSINIKQVLRMREEGRSIRYISQALKIPRATLARRLSQNHSEESGEV